MALVLATDVEDVDENGAIRVLAKRGESLPASLKDFKEQYEEQGILVEESFLPEGAASYTLTELQHRLASAGLSDEQLEEVQQAFQERRVVFDTPDADARRTIARDVSGNMAQVHQDRVNASPAIARTSGNVKPKAEAK